MEFITSVLSVVAPFARILSICSVFFIALWFLLQYLESRKGSGKSLKKTRINKRVNK